MFFRSAAKGVYHGVLRAAHPRLVNVGDGPPMVSFTFDDFPRSALLVGGRTLAAHGACGTYYVAPGLMGTTNELGEQFQARDLLDLVAAGHELGSHTLHHVSARGMSAEAFRSEIVEGAEALRATAGVRAVTNFSYPSGEVTLAAKRLAGGQCASCRGTQPGSNGPQADLNLLRANRLYSASVPFAQVAELIARHARPGRWLIFYTHDVRDAPSPYGCTPQYFEDSVRCAIDAGARVLTVADALASLAAPVSG